LAAAIKQRRLCRIFAVVRAVEPPMADLVREGEPVASQLGWVFRGIKPAVDADEFLVEPDRSKDAIGPEERREVFDFKRQAQMELEHLLNGYRSGDGHTESMRVLGNQCIGVPLNADFWQIRNIFNGPATIHDGSISLCIFAA
jgi:hypothetical protein